MNRLKKILTPVLVIILIVLVFSLAEITAFKATPENMTYSEQNQWHDAWDINMYISAIKWAQTHPYKFQNLYTTTPEYTPNVYAIYTFAGSLFPDTNPFMIFNMLKIITGVFLFTTIYWIIKNIARPKTSPLKVTSLVLISGGLGWLFYYIHPPDMATSSFSFVGVFDKPNTALSVSFYYLAMFLFFKGIKVNKHKIILFSSLSLLPVIILSPFLVLVYYVTTFVYALHLLRNDEIEITDIIKKYILISIIIIPITAAYSIYLLAPDTLGNIISPNLNSPPPHLLLIAYGVMSPIILLQLFSKNKSELLVFLNIWFFTSIIFSYLPFSFSRYFLRGLLFPAVLITLAALPQISEKLKISYKILLRIVIVLLPITTFIIIAATIITGLQINNEWVYLSKEKTEIMNYLTSNSTPGQGVLVNDYIFANQIPAFTGNSVYYGHRYNTPEFGEKEEKAEKFYEREFNHSEARDFLEQNNIEFVIITNDQRLNYDFLSKKFGNRSYDLYQTNL